MRLKTDEYFESLLADGKGVYAKNGDVFDLIASEHDDILLSEIPLGIQELHRHSADRPADFADLTLVTLSERQDVAEMIGLDSALDAYRRFRGEPSHPVPLG